MAWIYLSPHFDDIALSCGGLAWEQAQAGKEVSIWTVCGGEPPGEPFSTFAQEHHERWGAGPEAVVVRQDEDIVSCRAMGAAYRHFNLPDCLYRRADDYPDRPGGEAGEPFFLYDSLSALFGPLHPAEERLVDEVAEEFARLLPADADVVCPLALGGHVDHRLTRAAAEKLGREVWYYADYPYALAAGDLLAELRQEGWTAATFLVSLAGLEAWQEAVAAHATQISTFWPDLDAMRAAIREYAALYGGVELWKRR